MTKGILYFDIHAHHLPIVRAVARQGFLPVTNSPDFAQQLRQEGLPCGYWGTLLTPLLQAQIQQKTYRILSGLRASLSSPETRQNFTSPLGDFTAVTGEAFFQRLEEMISNEITAMEIFVELQQQVDLRLVVLGADAHHQERVLVQYARQHQIPTLQLAHGLNNKMLVRTAGEMHTLYSDYVAVYGERAREILIEMGNDAERIFLTGAPGWDSFYNPEIRLDKRTARQRLGLDPNRPTLLFCASYTEGSTALFPAASRELVAIYQALAQIMQTLGPQAQLIIRPHPNEYLRQPLPSTESTWIEQSYQRWAAQVGIDNLSLLREHKTEAIQAADAVIVHSESSILPEIMLLERPVILLHWLGQTAQTYTDRDGILVARDLEQLRAMTIKLMNSPAEQADMLQRQNAALPLMNYGHDGHATQRVTDLILELAEHPETRPAKLLQPELHLPEAVQTPAPARPAPRADEPVVASIIIPVLNQVAYTRQCIEAILNVGATVNYEIIVVDNGSADETPAYLQSLEGCVRMLRNDTNLGFSRACNQGAAMARGQYLIFLNNDTIPQAGWLDALLQSVNSNARIGIVGSRLLLPNGTIQHAGIFFANNGWTHHIYYGLPQDDPAVLQEREYAAVTGACLLIRQDLFESITGFDEDYPLYYEDVDLCLRAWQAGYRVVYCPTSVVIHFEATSSKDLKKRDEMITTGHQRMLQRWNNHWPWPQSVQLWPDKISWPAEVFQLYEKSQTLLSQQQAFAARTALKQALEMLPDEPQLIVALGNAFLQEGDIEAARREFVKSTCLAPNHAPGFAMLGLVLIFLKRLDEAEKTLQQAYALNPEDQNVKNLLTQLGIERSKAQANVPALRYNKVCEFEDFYDPELAETIRDVFRHEIRHFNSEFPKGAEYRKYWEIAMSVRALRHFGVLNRQSTILGVGAGTETTIFYLTNHVQQVVATDLYLDPGMWGKSAPGFMFTEPEKVAPYPFERDRLVVQHMDGRVLQFPDETFHGIFSSGSIEHFGSLMGVANAAYEMGRVLKPGGVLTLSTEFRISGPPEGFTWDYTIIVFPPELLKRYIIEASGLEVVDELDVHVSPQTMASKRSLVECVAEAEAQTDRHGKYPRVGEVIWSRYPHLVLEHAGYTFGSVHLTLRKTANYPATDNAWARPTPETIRQVQGNKNLLPLPPGTPVTLSSTAPTSPNPVPVTPPVKHQIDSPGAQSRLTIGIDARTLTHPPSLERGIGHYAFNHLLALVAQSPDWQYLLYLDESARPNSLVEQLLAFPNTQRRRSSDWFHDRPDLFYIVDPMNDTFDVNSFFHPTPGVPLSILFYDLIPLIMAPIFLDQWPVEMQGKYRYRLKQLQESQSLILTISESTRRDLHQHVHIPLERMQTILAGLNRSTRQKPPSEDLIQQILQKYHIKRPFFLTVGSLDPHKNFALTTDAFIRASSIRPMQLVIAGSLKDPYKQAYLKAFQQHHISNVIFTDFISREELECLYASATALLFPSQYEGFGMPILEAMASNCAVITSSAASIPEVAGDAAILVPPTDAQALAMAMLQLIENDALRTQLIQKGHDQVKKFTWEETARKTIAAWKSFLAGQAPQPAASALSSQAIAASLPATPDVTDSLPGVSKQAVAPQRSFETLLSEKKVGIDVRFLLHKASLDRGIGHYSFYHLQTLFKNYPQFRFILLTENNDLARQNETIGQMLQFQNVELGEYHAVDPDQLALLHIVDPMSVLVGIDSPFRLLPGVPKTAIFYDLIPLLFRDIYFKYENPAVVSAYLARLEQIKATDAHLLTISEATRNDLNRVVGVPLTRMTAVMAGLNINHSGKTRTKAEQQAALKRLGVYPPFFLSVGALDPHKNFNASGSAILAIQSRLKCQLVIAGSLDNPNTDYARKYIQEQGLKQFLFTGFVSRDDLETLYANAVALLFPSLYEGFGLPVLEAMAQGCPVITSNCGSLAEVAGDAALLVNPNNPDELANVMLRLANDEQLREELIQKGYEQAKKFTWDETTRKVVAAWRDYLNQVDQPVQVIAAAVPSPRPAHIVIDGIIYQWHAGQLSGVARVWSNLIPELVKSMPGARFTVLRRRGFPTGLQGVAEIEIPPYQPGPAETLDRDDRMLADLCMQLGASIFMSTYYTRAPGVPNVQLAYDMIPELAGYDMNYPEWLAKKRAFEHASAFAAISNSTRNDLLRLYPVKPEQVLTTYCGLSPAFRPGQDQAVHRFQKKYGLRAPYLLVVGKRSGYKNSIAFFQAYANLPQAKSVQVVTVGGETQLSDAEKTALQGRKITMLPYLPDDELALAYSGAAALVYPSRYEGFGLPVLEAMACGCPVITARNSSLPEVGGEAVIYVNPDAPEEIEAALHQVLDQAQRNRLIQAGKVQAGAFTWRKMAEGVAEVIHTVSRETAATAPSQPQPVVHHQRDDLLVTAIVSTYKAEAFIGECLSDLVSQTLFDRMEIIVVDAASPQNERSVVEAFQRRYPNISYIRTGERINVYAAWNIAVRLARGCYITPASTNDRLRPDAYEILARALDEHPEAALAYGDSYITETPHQTFEHHDRIGAMVWPEYSYEILSDNCQIGPHPMWRQLLHQEFGYFDEDFSAIGDYEFWLRIGKRYPMVHIPVFTGLYWRTKASLSGNEEVALPEIGRARAMHRDQAGAFRLERWSKAQARLPEAQALIQNGQTEQAAKLLKKLVDENPDYLTLLVLYGKTLFLRSQFEAAACQLKNVVTVVPDAWDVRLLLVDALEAARDSQAAAEALQLFLEVFPNDPRGLERRTRLAAYIRDVPAAAASTPEILPEMIQTAVESSGLVDIVIPIYGQADLLRRCVQSILTTTPGTHIILVDDCSPGEEIRQAFEEWSGQPHMTLARTPVNSGFIGACRLGASLGKAPYILFLNSDTQAIETGWLTYLLPDDEKVAIVGARLLYPPDMPGPLAGKLQHAGVARNAQGIPYHPFLGWAADTPEASQPRSINAVTGACFLIRRTVWEELKGWDARFGKGVYEDVDLCWQARQKGYTVLYQPAASLYHYESASKASDGRHNLNEHTQENLKKLLEKWKPLHSDEDLFFGEKTLRRWEKARRLIDGARSALEQRNFKSALANMKKAVDTAADLPDALVGYAQLLGARDRHAEAAVYYEKAVALAPAYWEARLRLVDEWLAAQKPEQAAVEILPLQAVFPQAPEIRQRAEKLAPYLSSQPSQPAVPAPSDTISIPALEAPSLSPGQKAAGETLRLLLEADDLPAALQMHRAQLNNDLLQVIGENAAAARQDGEIDLAEGLEGLAEYIQDMLQPPDLSRPLPPAPAASPAAQTLHMLLQAEDLPAALAANRDRLDVELLQLVQANAAAARQDGEIDLAEGLEALVDYLQDVLEVSPATLTISPRQRAVQTFERLLAAEDLLAALEANRDDLSAELAGLVRSNAVTARLDGQTDLAEGLETLAGYIQEAVDERTEQLFKRIYTSQDVLGTLQKHVDQLDDGLAQLALQNAQAAREKGEVQMAESLEALAKTIRQVIAERQH